MPSVIGLPYNNCPCLYVKGAIDLMNPEDKGIYSETNAGITQFLKSTANTKGFVMTHRSPVVRAWARATTLGLVFSVVSCAAWAAKPEWAGKGKGKHEEESHAQNQQGGSIEIRVGSYFGDDQLTVATLLPQPLTDADRAAQKRSAGQGKDGAVH